jgi:hypothetical protein
MTLSNNLKKEKKKIKMSCKEFSSQISPAVFLPLKIMEKLKAHVVKRGINKFLSNLKFTIYSHIY